MDRYVEQLNALGQPGRLQIFRLLVRAGPGGNCVHDIRRRVRMPGSTLSHHLDTLAGSGLIAARRSGRFIFYTVNWPEAARLIRFLTEDCCADMYQRFAAPAAAQCATANGTCAQPSNSKETHYGRQLDQGTGARKIRARG